MSDRLGRVLRRWGSALLLPASIVPLAFVVPVVVAAHQNFDRRHKSDPLPAPAAALTPWEARNYRPLAPTPDAVPVLVYHGINDDRDHYSVSRFEFAHQMALLRQMGFRSLSIAQYVRFLHGDRRGLPTRPLLITFDDGRLDSFRGADRILQRYGYRATMFVIPGQMRPNNPSSLTWKELDGMRNSGRWDIQEHAGAGHHRIAYDATGDMGPFYAFRRFTRSRGLESLADWERRVTTDVYNGREALLEHGIRSATFAVPYGNYGQSHTNDVRIPGIMRSFLLRQFETIFVQHATNDPDYTTATALHGEAQRYELHTTTTVGQLYRWLRDHGRAGGSRSSRAGLGELMQSLLRQRLEQAPVVIEPRSA
jgi:polysaccharide deacetylase